MRVLVCNGFAAGSEYWELCSFHHDWLFSYLEQADYLPERIIADFDEVVLVGFSMGGITALRLFLKYPEKVKALVLVSTTPRIMEDRSDGWSGLSERRMDALLFGTEMVFHGNPSPLYSHVNLVRGLEALSTADLRRELRSLGKTDLPVRVLQSERDGIVRPGNAEFFKSVFPQAKVTMVPGSEHVLPVAHPELVDAAVADVIEACCGQ